MVAYDWFKEHAFYLIAVAGLAATILCIAMLNGCATRRPIPVEHGIPNLVQVESAIWRGGQPTAEGWRHLYALGVTNVVKLNKPEEGNDGPAILLGMIVQNFPISAIDQTVGTPSRASIDAAARAIRHGTFVHCGSEARTEEAIERNDSTGAGGNDRSGLVVALWRVRVQGWSKDRAHAEMIACGFRPILHGLYEIWEDEPESVHVSHMGAVNLEKLPNGKWRTTKLCDCGLKIVVE